MANQREKASPDRGKSERRDEHKVAPVVPGSASLAAPGAFPVALGNRARLALLRSGQVQGMAHTGQVAALPARDAVPPQLTIGHLNDPQEHEADRIANRMTTAPEVSSAAAPPRIRRAIDAPRQVEVSSRPGGAGPQGDAGPAPDIVHKALRSAGQPLDPAARDHFEAQFGRDLSQVRVHADATAAASAQAIGARAYTVGQSIVFGAGEYAPDAEHGRKLLAHELVHVVQGGSVVRRQPKQTSEADTPVQTRVRASDIAGRGPPSTDWNAQFAPQPTPVDPQKVSSIAAAQAWVKDLSGFSVDEKRRFKIGEHLKSMIERLPPEVWLPSNEVISRSETDHSSLIVTGSIGPFDTDNLRNKLFTMYLAVDQPAELTKLRDPTKIHDATGIMWGADFNITDFVSEDDKAAEARFGILPDARPFHLAVDRFDQFQVQFTRRKLRILEFLFRDEMLEWRRRDVAVQQSVDRELDRRTGVFMAALGDVSIRAIGQFFKYTALTGVGAAFAAPVAGSIARGLGIGNLSTAGWGARILVGAGTGEVIGAGTSAVDSALSNAPALAHGDIGLGKYLSGILKDAWGGAKTGGLFGAAGEVASPLLRRLLNVIWPASKPLPLAGAPDVPAPTAAASATDPIVASPTPAAPAIVPDVAPTPPATPVAADPVVAPDLPAPSFKPSGNWFVRKLRNTLVSIKFGVTNANVIPNMRIGYAEGPNAALVDTAAPAPAAAPDIAPVAPTAEVTPAPAPSAPAVAKSVVPTDSEFEAAFAGLEAGLVPGQAAMLGDLMLHGQRREAIRQLRQQVDPNLRTRPLRTPDGVAVNPNPGHQSAHTTAQSALRDLPVYEPDDMITRLLPTGRGHAHTLFDQYWQAEFRQIQQATGRMTTTAQELSEVTARAARQSGAFSPTEAESVVQLIYEDLFVNLGLSPNQVLRMPGT